jgi:hypothetical protein
VRLAPNARAQSAAVTELSIGDGAVDASGDAHDRSLPAQRVANNRAQARRDVLGRKLGVEL